jgi:SSS family solute:Na+ symporter
MNIVILSGFLIFMLLIGVTSFKKISSLSSFYVSSRGTSSLWLAGSIVATTIGGSATLGLAGIGFSKGLPGAWWLMSGSICMMILAALWAKKVREYGVYTLPEILEKQYNSSTLKIVSSVVIIAAWMGIISAQMIAAGKILDILWPGYYRFFVILCGAVFIFYTVSGGQLSIIKTDFFQTLFIFTGIILILVLAFVKYGSPRALTLPESYLSFPVNNYFTYRDILIYFLFVGTSFLAGPDIYSRILSAKDSNTAKKGVFAAACMIMLIAVAVTLIGVYAKGVNPGIAPEGAFLDLAMNILPESLKGLLLAALLAAVMSSADTCLLTSGVILSADVLKPLFYRDIDEKKELKYTRIIILLLGIFSLSTALYIDGIIKSLLLALTVYTSGIIIPVVFGFYREKLSLNAAGAVSACIAGGGSALIMKISGMDQFLVYIFSAAVIILFAVSRICGKYINSKA